MKKIIKRLWVINQFANTPEMPGHTRQFEVSKYLVKKGWKVNLFASDFNLTERKFKKLNIFTFSFIEKIDGINWNWLRVTPYFKNDLLRYINIISFCIHLFFKLLFEFIYYSFNENSKKIVIASSPQLPAAFISLLLAQLFRIPFVFEVRDLWPQVLIDQGGKSKKSILVRLLIFFEEYLYKNSNYIVVLAEGAKNYVEKRGGVNICWLPNGPDLSIFKPSQSKYNENLKISKKSPFKIIYAGAHGPANGLNNVIEAARLILHKPIEITFIGDGSEKNYLIQKSIDYSLHNIKFLKPVPKVKMPSILSNYDSILISLKKLDLFSYGISPNKLYDAYALAKPVITTIPGNINNEVIKYNLGTTAEAEDPISLANAIINLVNKSSKERFEMGLRGRDLAEKIYSRQLINKKYELILNKLIEF